MKNLLKAMARLRIEATVIVCGAILMALEIIGGRLLTPYYGDTVYVWGSVIGIFLLSLSLGYYLGGKLADRKPDYSTLSAVLIIVGMFTLAVPFLYRPVTELSNSFPRMFAPMVSVTLLFLIPSLLLGMVSPFAIKLKARTIRKIGKLSGNLYALSTMGSVIGTFLATFVLILFLPVTTILFCLGATSFLVASILLKRKFSLIVFLAALLIFSLSISAANPAPIDIIDNSAHTGNNVTRITDQLPHRLSFESLYGQVSVEDTIHQTRTLSLNGGVMSEMDINDESRVLPGWKYINCMQIPFIMNPNIDDVLVLGLGAGQFQRKIYKEFGADIDNVDINSKILEVAQAYFNLTLTDSFRAYIDDARVFLQRTDKKYDYIAVDVVHYDPAQGYRMPFHLATREFFELVKQHLNPHGVLAINLVSNTNGKFYSSEYKTINSTFQSVYSFSCDTQVIIASTDRKYSMDELKSRAGTRAGFLDNYFQPAIRADGIILTDDFSPINPFDELVVNETKPAS